VECGSKNIHKKIYVFRIYHTTITSINTQGVLLIPFLEIGHTLCTSDSVVMRGFRCEPKSITNNLGARDMNVFMEALTKILHGKMSRTLDNCPLTSFY
jgi:hypothetical protein